MTGKLGDYIVIGKDSRLAQSFLKQFPGSVALSKADCDITQSDKLYDVIHSYGASFVLNCAALTDLEYCENNQDECMRVNYQGVCNLVDVCKRLKKRLIHISSDYAVNPVNCYGRSKSMSEQAVGTTGLVVRTNFYDEKTYLVRELLSGHTVTAYTNVSYNPLSVNRLVLEIDTHKNTSGVVVLGTDSPITPYVFASKLAKVFHIDPKLIGKSSFDNIAGKALRPLDSFIIPSISVDISSDLADFKDYLARHGL